MRQSLLVCAALLAVTNAAADPPSMLDAPPPNKAPSSAIDDLNKSGAANASEQLGTLNKTIETAAKVKDKYESMDAAKKVTWDAAWKKTVEARDTADKKDNTAAGYAAMTLVEKTVYDSELYEWKVAIHQICKTTPTKYTCTEARAIRDKIEANRKTTKFYSKTGDDLKKLKEAEVATTKKYDDETKAKWALDVVKGAVGFACTADTACATTQCCGTATPKANKAGDVKGVQKVCNTKAATSYTDKATAAFVFSCGKSAIQLVASASAILAAAYLM